MRPPLWRSGRVARGVGWVASMVVISTTIVPISYSPQAHWEGAMEPRGTVVLRMCILVAAILMELFLITAPSPAAALPPVSRADMDKALECGLSAGLEKLKNGPPEAQDLYHAIQATLTGRNLAENRRLLRRAAAEFGLDVLPLGACFRPIFFPDQAGAGPSPAAPSNLTVLSAATEY